MQKKKAISLIVLVITIIVMIILAGTIIISLNNSGIIEKANEAVEQTNLATVKELTQMAWAEAYAGGTRTEQGLKEAVDKALEDNDIDADKYVIDVTTKGVTIALKGQNTNPWVAATVDGVPIPKGFVASPYGADEANGIPAENTKAGGLVIYELTADERAKGATSLPKDETQYTSWTTRNQYVWIPVADISTKKFQRVAWDDTWGEISDTLGIGIWEVTPDIKNIDLTATYDNPYYEECMDTYGISEDCIEWYGNPILKAGDFVTQTTIDEVTEMYESVEKYGGFYIARYEAGLDLDNHTTSSDKALRTEVHSKMNKAPYNYIAWANSKTMSVETGGAVEVARGIYPKTNSNYGVVSTLAYGVQWDSLVQWLADKGINVVDDSSYGNYSDSKIANSTFNQGAYVSKDYGNTYTPISSNYSESGTYLFSTGATTQTRVYNIYDIAGNVFEWTMEGLEPYARVTRGNTYSESSFYGAVSSRNTLRILFVRCGSRTWVPCGIIYKEIVL